MPSIPVRITSFVDDHFPGFVECLLVDAAGTNHIFVEKAPVVSVSNLSFTSTYPCDGSIACTIIAAWMDIDGQALVRVSTAQPWAMESTDGQTEFVLFDTQVRNSEAGS